MAATINKQEIIAKYGRTPNDTGSPEVQIALQTSRITLQTTHQNLSADWPPENAHEGSPLQTWSAENGWSEKRSAELPEGNRYRKIPCNHCRTGSEKVIYRWQKKGGANPPFLFKKQETSRRHYRFPTFFAIRDRLAGEVEDLWCEKTTFKKRRMIMFRSYSMELAGRTLTAEIGWVAEQANGACLMRYGDTTGLVTATASDKPREGIDFFPLSIDYEERLYSVGKIPGGFIKREGRPSEKAVLTARCIDSPLRPLFP